MSALEDVLANAIQKATGGIENAVGHSPDLFEVGKAYLGSITKSSLG